MNIGFYTVNTKEEIFSGEFPSMEKAYEAVEEYFGEMAQAEGDNDLTSLTITQKRPKVWLITNFGTGGTYLLYIKQT